MEVIIHDNNGAECQFTCPYCKVTSLYRKAKLENYSPKENYHSIECNACGRESIWRTLKFEGTKVTLERLHPLTSSVPPPNEDMPEDVQKDYHEASLVSLYSSKAACALLRLALQKLCKHLGEPGENINTDIRSLAKKDDFSPRIIQAADTLRIVGNKAVHPGEMSDDDIDEVCQGLFSLLNLIVEQGITKPKEFDALYAKVPAGPRLAAEKSDQKPT